MTQASISLVTTPIGLADLEPLLYELTLAVNLSGIGSGPVAYPAQPLPTSWLASLNSFAAAVNAVTAFNTVTEATTSDPASLAGIVNTMIEEINAYQPGGGGYTAKAVNFDGTATLDNTDDISFADSPLLTFSVWVLVPMGSAPQFWWNSDQITGKFNSFSNNWNVATDLFVQLTAANASDYFAAITQSGVVVRGTWYNILFSGKTDLSAGNKLGVILKNGVDVSGTPDDGQSSFSAKWNGTKLGVPTIGDILDMADFQMWVGQAVDLSDAGNVAKFISGGKPVDPAVAALAFGPPTFLFSGDATGFIVNQGTGGAFTLTGALTNASTSPSD